jgi:hypothetical protein
MAEFVTSAREDARLADMTTPNAATTGPTAQQTELEEELRRAKADFAHGDFLELTLEEIDRCIEAADWAWPDGSS